MQLEPEWIDYSIERMKEVFETSTVENIVYNMKDLGCGHNSARIEVLGYQWFTMTELLHKPIKRVLARHIVTRFYGGPPDRRGVYDGTLITMLIDRLLQNAVTTTKAGEILSETN